MGTRAFWIGFVMGLLVCGVIIAVLLTLGGREEERQEIQHGVDRMLGGAR